MASLPGKVDRQTTTPFLLKVFYREGSFPPLTEFHAPTAPPSHLTLYTWPTCTLSELSHLLAHSRPDLLPDPQIGTRLSFRLIFPDARSPASGAHGGAGRFLHRDLGSVVLGEGLQGGADEGEEGREEGMGGEGMGETGGAKAVGMDGGATTTAMTLKDFRFVIGDYISVAILPPLTNGNVAPPLAMQPGTGVAGGGGGVQHHQQQQGIDIGARDGRHYQHSHHAPQGGFGGGKLGRENSGFGGFRGGSRGRGGGWGGGGAGGGPGMGGGGPRGPALPSGEWRRGERLPDGPPGMGGAGGGRSGRIGYGGGRGRERW